MRAQDGALWGLGAFDGALGLRTRWWRRRMGVVVSVLDVLVIVAVVLVILVLVKRL